MLRKLKNQNKKKRKRHQRKRPPTQSQLQLKLLRLKNGLHQLLSLNFMISKQSCVIQRISKLPQINFFQLTCGMIMAFLSGYSNMKNSMKKKELKFTFATICSMVSFKEWTIKLDHTPQVVLVFMETQGHLSNLVSCYGEDLKFHQL